MTDPREVSVAVQEPGARQPAGSYQRCLNAHREMVRTRGEPMAAPRTCAPKLRRSAVNPFDARSAE